MRTRLFFCGLQWPRFPGRSGGEIRDFHLIQALLGFSKIRAFSLWDSTTGGEERLRHRLEGWHVPSSEDMVRARPSLLDRVRLRGQQRGWPVPGAKWHADAATHAQAARALRSTLESALVEERPDFLMVSPQINPILSLAMDRCLETRTVLATYDVEAVRIERMHATAAGLARLALGAEQERAAHFERENLSHFDGVIAVSDLDARAFAARYAVDSERILVIDNGVDPDYFSFRPRPQPVGPPAVIFTGAMSYPANERAARRLLDDILPRVRKTQAVRALIVGQGPGAALASRHDGDSTVITGKVDDVRSFLEQAHVTCVPLAMGSGTKIKMLDAMSAGVPIVCSPLAAEGLDVVNDEHVLIAESDEEHAAAVNLILSQPALSARLTTNARSLIERRYSWETGLRGLEPGLDRIRSLPRRSAPGRPL